LRRYSAASREDLGSAGTQSCLQHDAARRGRYRNSSPNSSARRTILGQFERSWRFDFDNDFLSLHTTGALEQAANNFQQSKASRVSSGTVMVEKASTAAERGAKVRDILVGLGVSPAAVNVQLINDAREPDGISDPWSRKVTLSVKR
jgi:hypothetical protein